MSTPRASMAVLSVGALGVVFGDIGTSPLYALKEAFHSHSGHDVAVTPDNVVGLISLVFWAMTLVISIKYVRFVMRADNHGEGGILALTALIQPKERTYTRTPVLVLLGLFGAALLYGDGMITPAISVLSAVEGTTVVTESLDSAVVPIAVGILVALFAVQSRGTSAVGRAFGPVMVLWFAVLALLGVAHIADAPEIFKAINPWYGLQFFADNGWTGLLALGSVVLVVTGGEALYADMGHFGAPPIKRAWYLMAMPGLMLNYFGQGAMLLEDPELSDNPFFRMAPEWLLWPLVVLATAATVIASQALISGAFSLTRQAVQLGYLPRVRIEHTSEETEGQIYVPVVNWVLCIACVGLVIGFGSSTNLAAAYGLAVTGTMAITTVLFYVFLVQQARWSRTKAGALSAGFLIVDLAFLAANIPKIPAGGWFPLAVGLVLLLALTTWFAGRRITIERVARSGLPLADFVDEVAGDGRGRTPGAGVYMGRSAGVTPQALAAHQRHAGVLPERVCVLAVVVADVPHVERAEQLVCKALGAGFYQLTHRVGFMDPVDVPAALRELGGDLAAHGIDFDEVSYVLGRETLRVTDRPGMAKWREHLFVRMVRNANTADVYFNLPPEQTIEIGVQVEL